jgi:two-component system OmpR family response regulator
LVARIQSVLRRYETKQSGSKSSVFSLNEDLMEISKDGKALKLTPAEYGILSYLIKNRQRVVSREELLNNVDALNYESSYKSIDVIVGRIRQKIETNPKKPHYLQAVRGIGYKLVE